MTKRIEYKQVALGDSQFLIDLTDKWMCWQGESPTKQITIVAVEGAVGDWAAYFETPSCGSRVKENGDKFPKEVAAQLFPDWATKYTWRY